MPIQTATNPQTGARVALINNEWVPITQSATNSQGGKAYLINGNWVVDEPPSTERTWGEAIGDVGVSAAGGVGSLIQLPGQLYGLATGDFSRTGALGFGKDVEEYWKERKSAGLKAREAARTQKVKEAEKVSEWQAFKAAFGETITDPALLTSFLAEQAPQLLVPFGAAKVAQIGTGAKALAASQGLTGAAAEQAVKEVAKAAGKRGVTAAVGAGAVQQGADVGADTYESIHKELKKQGASDKEAAEGAINLARAAGASAAVISVLAQRLPGAKALEETFAGVRGPGGRLARAGKGALGEGASEVVEETGGKFGSNLAMREVAPETPLTSGLGETAGMAAIGGLGMGAATGLTRGAQASTSPAVAPAVPPTPPTPAAPPVPAAPPTPATPAAPPASPIPTLSAEQVKEQVDELMSTLPGVISEADAIAIVAEREKRRTAKEEERAAIEPPIEEPVPVAEAPQLNEEQTQRLRDLTEDFLAFGLPPEEAAAEALDMITREIEADAEAARAPTGEGNVAGPVSPTGGEGVGLAGEPGAGAATAGVGVVEPSGVVPSEPDVGGPPSGEGAQPGAVVETKIEAPTPPVEPPAPPAYTPSPAVAARIAELEAEQKKLLTKAGKPPAPNSKARVQYDELQYEIDLVKSGASDIVQEVEQQAKIKEAVEVARFFAVTAFDQRREYASLEEAFESYRENVRDTLRELRISNQFSEEAAFRVFDAEAARLSGTQAPTTPTAPAATGAKRGRPKIERTPEQQAALEEQRKNSKNTAQAADYALKKAQAQLDSATAPIDEGQFDSEESLKDARDNQLANKRAAIRRLIELSEDKTLRGTTVAKRIAKALKDPRISPTEMADIKRGMEVTRKTLSDKSTVLSAANLGVYPPNPDLSTATTAAQALSAIARTGNAFQRFLANRLRNLLPNVKFVVIEEGAPLPEELKPFQKDWKRAKGMFVPSLDAIYVRGASFGANQGVNNVTALHELIHAATLRKLAYAVVAFTRPNLPLEPKLRGALTDLIATMGAAKAAYLKAVDSGRVDPEVQRLYEGTRGAIFTDPFEFLSYGQTEPALQGFLSNLTVARSPNTGFSRFVRSIMNILGVQETATHVDAMTSLVDASDRIIGSRVPTKISRMVAESLDPQLQRNQNLARRAGIRSARELKKQTLRALRGLEQSKTSEMHKRIGVLQRARDEGSIAPIIEWAYSKADYNTRVLLANLPSFDFLARWTEKTLPPIKDAYVVVQKMLGHTQQLHEAGVSQVQMLSKDFKQDKTLERKLNDLLPLVTILQVDPADTKSLERVPELNQMYANLGTFGQQVYRRIIDFHERLREYHEQLLDQQISNLPGLSAEVKKNMLAQIYKKFQDERRIEPYIPLVRDAGQFWLAVGEGKNTQIYIYETREQRNEDAERIAKERYGKPAGLLKEQGEMGVGNELKELRGRVDLQGTMLSQLFNAIDSAVPADAALDKTSVDINAQLKNDMFDLWLAMMPEQAFRKQFVQRKSRPGYRPDIRRNIASHMARVAPALSRIKYGNALRSEMTRVRELVHDQEELTPFKKSFDARIAKLLSPDPRGFWDAVAGAANKVTYLTYLTGTVTALLQPASIYVSALPILAANHNRNPAAVAKELGKMLVYLKQYGVTKTLPNGNVQYVAPTLAHNKSLPADEIRAIRAMTAMNVAHQTYAGFLWDVSNADAMAVSDEGIKGRGAQLADLLLNALLRNTERLTREVVYLASYRLGRERGLTEAEAIEQAAMDTKESLGDYDIASRPTWMQGPLGRVAFSMKMYPVIVIQQLFGNMVKMLPVLNKEGKAQAFKKFSGIMMTAATLAGIYNMPFADLIITMLAQMLKEHDDEDMPADLRDLDPVTWFKTVWMKEKLGDYKIGNTSLDELIGEGPLVLTGRALGQRVGLNDLWARDGKPSGSIPEAIQAFLLSYFGGPVTSFVMSVGKGVEDFAIGDYERGLERIVPLAPARNLLTARRAAKEGYETPKGELVSPEEVSKADLVWQAMGVTPADVAAARDASFKLTGAQQQVLIQRDLIMRRLKHADLKDKDDLMDDILSEQVPKFNAKYPTYRITGEQIKEILMSQREQRAKSRAGMVVDKKNAPLTMDTVDALEDRLERRSK